MNEPQSPANVGALIAAAKADGPSAARAAGIWTAVSTSVGAGAPMTAGGVGAAKLLVGTLLGGTLTVGLAATLLWVGVARRVDAAHGAAGPVAAARAFEVSPSLNAPASPLPESIFARSPSPTPVSFAIAAPSPRAAVDSATSAPAPPSRSVGLPSSQVDRGAARAQPEDPLAREASLVAAARSALSHGRPRAALATIRATHALRARQLAPEELAVEAQALRALGLSDDADAVELSLKVRYPESALAQ
jgi:hypothetical protein